MYCYEHMNLSLPAHLGEPIELERVNESTRLKYKKWRDCHTKDTVAWVAERYAEEIKMFGFSWR